MSMDPDLYPYDTLLRVMAKKKRLKKPSDATLFIIDLTRYVKAAYNQDLEYEGLRDMCHEYLNQLVVRDIHKKIEALDSDELTLLCNELECLETIAAEEEVKKKPKSSKPKKGSKFH